MGNFDVLKSYQINITADTTQFLEELSKLDKKTKEEIKKAGLSEGFRDDLKKLQKDINEMRNSLSDSVGYINSSLNVAVNDINDKIKEIKTDQLEKEFKDAAKGVEQQVGNITNSTDRLEKSLKSVSENAEFSILSDRFKAMQKSIENSITSLTASLSDLSKEFKDLKVSFENNKNSNNGINNLDKSAEKTVKAVKKKRKATQKEIQAQTKLVEDYAKKVASAYSTINLIVNQKGISKKTGSFLMDNINEQIGLIDEFVGAYEKLKKMDHTMLPSINKLLPKEYSTIKNVREDLDDLKRTYLGFGSGEKKVNNINIKIDFDDPSDLVDRINKDIVDKVQKNVKPIKIPLGVEAYLDDDPIKGDKKLQDKIEGMKDETGAIKAISLTANFDRDQFVKSVNDQIDGITNDLKKSGKAVHIDLVADPNKESIDKAIGKMIATGADKEINATAIQQINATTLLSADGNLATENTLSEIRDILRGFGSKGKLTLEQKVIEKADSSNSSDSEFGPGLLPDAAAKDFATFKKVRLNGGNIAESKKRDFHLVETLMQDLYKADSEMADFNELWKALLVKDEKEALKILEDSKYYTQLAYKKDQNNNNVIDKSLHGKKYNFDNFSFEYLPIEEFQKQVKEEFLGFRKRIEEEEVKFENNVKTWFAESGNDKGTAKWQEDFAKLQRKKYEDLRASIEEKEKQKYISEKDLKIYEKEDSQLTLLEKQRKAYIKGKIDKYVDRTDNMTDLDVLKAFRKQQDAFINELIRKEPKSNGKILSEVINEINSGNYVLSEAEAKELKGVWRKEYLEKARDAIRQPYKDVISRGEKSIKATRESLSLLGADYDTSLTQEQKQAIGNVKTLNDELRKQNEYREESVKKGEELSASIKSKILGEKEYQALVLKTTQAQEEAKKLNLEIDKNGYAKQSRQEKVIGRLTARNISNLTEEDAKQTTYSQFKIIESRASGIIADADKKINELNEKSDILNNLLDLQKKIKSNEATDADKSLFETLRKGYLNEQNLDINDKNIDLEAHVKDTITRISNDIKRQNALKKSALATALSEKKELRDSIFEKKGYVYEGFDPDNTKQEINRLEYQNKAIRDLVGLYEEDYQAGSTDKIQGKLHKKGEQNYTLLSYIENDILENNKKRIENLKQQLTYYNQEKGITDDLYEIDKQNKENAEKVEKTKRQTYKIQSHVVSSDITNVLFDSAIEGKELRDYTDDQLTARKDALIKLEKELIDSDAKTADNVIEGQARAMIQSVVNILVEKLEEGKKKIEKYQSEIDNVDSNEKLTTKEAKEAYVESRKDWIKDQEVKNKAVSNRIKLYSGEGSIDILKERLDSAQKELDDTLFGSLEKLRNERAKVVAEEHAFTRSSNDSELRKFYHDYLQKSEKVKNIEESIERNENKRISSEEKSQLDLEYKKYAKEAIESERKAGKDEEEAVKNIKSKEVWQVEKQKEKSDKLQLELAEAKKQQSLTAREFIDYIKKDGTSDNIKNTLLPLLEQESSLDKAIEEKMAEIKENKDNTEAYSIYESKKAKVSRAKTALEKEQGDSLNERAMKLLKGKISAGLDVSSFVGENGSIQEEIRAINSLIESRKEDARVAEEAAEQKRLADEEEKKARLEAQKELEKREMDAFKKSKKRVLKKDVDEIESIKELEEKYQKKQADLDKLRSENIDISTKLENHPSLASEIDTRYNIAKENFKKIDEITNRSHAENLIEEELGKSKEYQVILNDIKNVKEEIANLDKQRLENDNSVRLKKEEVEILRQELERLSNITISDESLRDKINKDIEDKKKELKSKEEALKVSETKKANDDISSKERLIDLQGNGLNNGTLAGLEKEKEKLRSKVTNDLIGSYQDRLKSFLSSYIDIEETIAYETKNGIVTTEDKIKELESLKTDIINSYYDLKTLGGDPLDVDLYKKSNNSKYLLDDFQKNTLQDITKGYSFEEHRNKLLEQISIDHDAAKKELDEAKEQRDEYIQNEFDWTEKLRENNEKIKALEKEIEDEKSKGIISSRKQSEYESLKKEREYALEIQSMMDKINDNSLSDYQKKQIAENDYYLLKLKELAPELKTQNDLLKERRAYLISLTSGLYEESDIEEFKKSNEEYKTAQKELNELQENFNAKLAIANKYLEKRSTVIEKGRTSGLAFDTGKTGRLLKDTRTQEEIKNKVKLVSPDEIVDYSFIKSVFNEINNRSIHPETSKEEKEKQDAYAAEVAERETNAVKETVKETLKLERIKEEVASTSYKVADAIKGMTEDEVAAVKEVYKLNRDLKKQTRWRRKDKKGKLSDENKAKLLNEKDYQKLIADVQKSQANARTLGLEIGEDGYVKSLSDNVITEREREGKTLVTGAVDVNTVVNTGALATEATLEAIHDLLAEKLGKATLKEVSTKEGANKGAKKGEKNKAVENIKKVKDKTKTKDEVLLTAQKSPKIRAAKKRRKRHLDPTNAETYMGYELMNPDEKAYAQQYAGLMKELIKEDGTIDKAIEEKMSSLKEKILKETKLIANSTNVKNASVPMSWMRSTKDRDKKAEKAPASKEPEKKDNKKGDKSTNTKKDSQSQSSDKSPETPASDLSENIKTLSGEFKNLGEKFRAIFALPENISKEQDLYKLKMLGEAASEKNILNNKFLSESGLASLLFKEDGKNKIIKDILPNLNEVKNAYEKYVQLWNEQEVEGDNIEQLLGNRKGLIDAWNKINTITEKPESPVVNTKPEVQPVQAPVVDIKKEKKQWKEYNDLIAFGYDRVKKMQIISDSGTIGNNSIYDLLRLNHPVWDEVKANNFFNDIPEDGLKRYNKILEVVERIVEEMVKASGLTEDQIIQQLKDIKSAKGGNFKLNGADSGWTHFASYSDSKNKDAMQKENGLTYKVYASFDDIKDLNQNVISSIMEELTKAGFKGRLKTTSGSTSLNDKLNALTITDQMVVHGATKKDQEIAYNVLKNMGLNLSYLGGGIDTPDGSFSETLRSGSISKYVKFNVNNTEESAKQIATQAELVEKSEEKKQKSFKETTDEIDYQKLAIEELIKIYQNANRTLARSNISEKTKENWSKKKSNVESVLSSRGYSLINGKWKQNEASTVEAPVIEKIDTIEVPVTPVVESKELDEKKKEISEKDIIEWQDIFKPLGIMLNKDDVEKIHKEAYNYNDEEETEQIQEVAKVKTEETTTAVESQIESLKELYSEYERLSKILGNMNTLDDGYSDVSSEFKSVQRKLKHRYGFGNSASDGSLLAPGTNNLEDTYKYIDFVEKHNLVVPQSIKALEEEETIIEDIAEGIRQKVKSEEELIALRNKNSKILKDEKRIKKNQEYTEDQHNAAKKEMIDAGFLMREKKGKNAKENSYYIPIMPNSEDVKPSDYLSTEALRIKLYGDTTDVIEEQTSAIEVNQKQAKESSDGIVEKLNIQKMTLEELLELYNKLLEISKDTNNNISGDKQEYLKGILEKEISNRYETDSDNVGLTGFSDELKGIKDATREELEKEYDDLTNLLSLSFTDLTDENKAYIIERKNRIEKQLAELNKPKAYDGILPKENTVGAYGQSVYSESSSTPTVEKVEDITEGLKKAEIQAEKTEEAIEQLVKTPVNNKREEENLEIKAAFQEAAALSGIYYDKKSLTVTKDGLVTFTKITKEAGEEAVASTYRIKNLYDAINKEDGTLNLESDAFKVTKTKATNKIDQFLNKLIASYEKLINIESQIIITEDKLKKSELESRYKAESLALRKLIEDNAELMDVQEAQVAALSSPKVQDAMFRKSLAKPKRIESFKGELESIINSNHAQEIDHVLAALYDPSTEDRIEKAKKDLTELKVIFDKLNSTDFDQDNFDLSELDKARKVMERFKESSSIFDDEMAVGDSKDLGYISKAQAKDLQGTLVNLSKSFSGVQVGVRSFSKSNREMTFQLENSKGMIDTYTISINKSGKAIAQLVKSEKKLNLFQKVFHTVGKKFGEILNYTIASVSIYEVFNFFRRGVTVVQEMDAAMTELRKVSNDSEQALESFRKKSYEIADAVASTGKEIVNSAADWTRLGYSIKEASELAKNTAIYSNVGDMEIDVATEHMISSIKAWESEFENEVEASEAIVDRYNEIGNNFAISSAEIGEAMERSAAALKAGGNTLNESLGIIVAGNVIQQDAETTAAALKILSLRIRGSKAELEEMGESTDGLASSTSKLREQIKGLSGVDIMLNEDTYKSTAQIIKELGKVYNQMSDVSQAALLETIAGKNRASTVEGLLQNYELIDEVIKAAENSTGSAAKENEKYMDSIQGHLDILTNKWQQMWDTAIETDVVNFVIDLGSDILDLVNKVGFLKSAFVGLGAIFGIKQSVIGGGRARNFVVISKLITHRSLINIYLPYYIY